MLILLRLIGFQSMQINEIFSFSPTHREGERQRIVGHKEVDDFIFMLCLTTNFSIGVFHKQSHSVSHVNYLCASIFSLSSLSLERFLLVKHVGVFTVMRRRVS